jgi:hypothetical protein
MPKSEPSSSSLRTFEKAHSSRGCGTVLPMAWHVYLLRCGDGTLYAGATTDLLRRLAAHAGGKGARYTRGRGPLVLAWSA